MTNPLHMKRIGNAITILILASGAGLAFMSFQFFAAGMVISALGAAGAIWIYWSDLRYQRLGSAGLNGAATLRYTEILIISSAIVIAVAVPAYVYYGATRPSTPRHLSNDQKARMAAELRLAPNENYSVEINCIPNCDECADYADQLRGFIGRVPGWKAGSNTSASHFSFRYGLKIITRADEKNLPAPQKLTKAFEVAGIALEHEEEDLPKELHQILIVVAEAPPNK